MSLNITHLFLRDWHLGIPIASASLDMKSVATADTPRALATYLNIQSRYLSSFELVPTLLMKFEAGGCFLPSIRLLTTDLTFYKYLVEISVFDKMKKNNNSHSLPPMSSQHTKTGVVYKI